MSPALQADSLLTEPHESPTTVKFIETQGRLVVNSTGGGEGGKWRVRIQWVEFQFVMMKKSCKWMVVMVTEQCECT